MTEEERLLEQCRAVAYSAGKIHDWLSPILGTSSAAESGYFKGRLKLATDIRDKVNAKRNDQNNPRPNYQPKDVTDASGFRIVRLFNTEIPETLRRLLDFPDVEMTREHVGGTVSIKEIEFHTNQRNNHPMSIYHDVKEVVEAKGYTLKVGADNPNAAAGTPKTKAKPLKAKAGAPKPDAGKSKKKHSSSYSSVHILFECSRGSEQSFSEIQLRSIYEEAWSEISHALKYADEKAARAAGRTPSDDEETKDFWLHLDALKSLTDGCAQYADLIHRQMPRDDSSPNRNTTPLNPPDKQTGMFKRFGPKIFDLIKTAFDRRTAAIKVSSTDQAARAVAFRLAADAFLAAVDAFPKPKNDADAARLLDVLREENAYCSMFSKDDGLIARAQETYRELCRTRPERVSVWLRLGQLRRDDNDFEEARQLMKRGLEVLATQPHEDAEAHRQASWLLRRDLAYVCWKAFDLDRKRDDAATLLTEAVTQSEAALKFAGSDFQRLNARQNLLYYLFDVWRVAPPDRKAEALKRGQEMLAEVRPQVDLGKWSTDEIDTIVRGEDAFGDLAEAKRLAKVVVQRITQDLRAKANERNISWASAFEALSADERDIFLYSQEVVSREDED